MCWEKRHVTGALGRNYKNSRRKHAALYFPNNYTVNLSINIPRKHTNISYIRNGARFRQKQHFCSINLEQIKANNYKEIYAIRIGIFVSSELLPLERRGCVCQEQIWRTISWDMRIKDVIKYCCQRQPLFLHKSESY